MDGGGRKEPMIMSWPTALRFSKSIGAGFNYLLKYLVSEKLGEPDGQAGNFTKVPPSLSLSLNHFLTPPTGEILIMCVLYLVLATVM